LAASLRPKASPGGIDFSEIDFPNFMLDDVPHREVLLK
jgi:hypothetical protein